jgi:hypothetical protein
MQLKPAFVLACIILVYLVSGIASLNAVSVTADEPSHLAFGIRMLRAKPERPVPEKDNSKMPISALNALPRAAEQLLQPGLKKTDNGASDILHGRYITLALSVITILLVYRWSSQLYGTHAGLFSAFLMALCPNNQANAILVTTDAYASLFLLAAMYSIWKYCNQRSLKNLILFSVLLAAAQLAKQSLFHLYVLVPLCIIIYGIAMRLRFDFKKVLLHVMICLAVSWLVINAGFAFYKINNRLGDFRFMSNLFQKVQQWLPAGTPVPVSYSFVEGLDQAKYYDQLGGGLAHSSFGTVNILGKSVPGGSLWYYFFITILFKTPLSFLFFIALAKWRMLKNGKLQKIMANEFFLLAPVLYFILLMSFMYNTQCGMRHIIFIYPLLLVFCGSIFSQVKTKAQKMAVLIPSLLLPLSLAPYWNNYYAYTNELVWDKTNAYRIVGTGNLNITQAYNYLQEYLRQHSDVHYAPAQPVAGQFVVSVDEYMDVWNTGQYKWLQHYKPVGNVAYCYLLFDIRP